MPIKLPANFKNDIQGKDTSLVPVVVIGDWNYGDPLWSGSKWDTWITSSIVLSTNSFSLTEGVMSVTDFTTVTASPLLLNIPSLKESIDIEKRNYKISSVNLDISNFPYNGERFSDSIGDSSLINTEVRIYWTSPTTTWYEPFDITANLPTSPSPNTALQIYFGTIRRYTHDTEKVRLVVEDRSQATLHKDLPLEKNYLTGTGVPDKYKNKPIPMVYGHVDRSPLVIESLNSLSEYSIIADSVNVNFPESNPLYVYNENLHIKVLENSINYNHWEYAKSLQYSVNTDGSITTAPIDHTDASNTVLSDGAVEVELINNAVQRLYTSTNNSSMEISDATMYEVYPATSLEETIFIESKRETAELGGDLYNTRYGIDFQFNPIPNAYIDDFNITIHWDVAVVLTDSTLPAQYFGLMATVNEKVYEGYEIDAIIDDIFDESDYDGFISGTGIFINNNSHTAEGYYSLLWKDVFNEKVNIMTRIYRGGSISEGEGYGANMTLSINNFYAKINYLLKDFINQDFYANVNGRKSDNSKAPIIIEDILKTELGVTGIDVTGTYDWKYAFTVDKKINSKKLIEGIASASPYIPRFNNMGEFKFTEIPEGLVTAEHTIKEVDVIDFSFSRTKIEDVYTKIVFNYNWDYARKEFNDRVTSEVGTTIGDYEPEYYGFKEIDGDEHAESTLEISDDRGKYIRKSDNHDTAQDFADWYLMWSCNQHLILKVKLPVSKGMNLEIGDMVDFDAILGGVKPYGIYYIEGGKVNHQDVLTTFLITSTNKTIEWVEIECVQMHSLNSGNVYGCTDENNCNYQVNNPPNVSDPSQCYDEDCAGVCGGDAVEDCCGDCGGAAVGCDSGCDVCGDEGLELDECGVCGGDGSSCADCEGTPNGDAVLDECGECGGDNSPDECGVNCGDNSCLPIADAGEYQAVEAGSTVQFDLSETDFCPSSPCLEWEAVFSQYGESCGWVNILADYEDVVSASIHAHSNMTNELLDQFLHPTFIAPNEACQLVFRLDISSVPIGGDEASIQGIVDDVPINVLAGGDIEVEIDTIRTGILTEDDDVQTVAEYPFSGDSEEEKILKTLMYSGDDDDNVGWFVLRDIQLSHSVIYDPVVEAWFILSSEEGDNEVEMVINDTGTGQTMDLNFAGGLPLFDTDPMGEGDTHTVTYRFKLKTIAGSEFEVTKNITYTWRDCPLMGDIQDDSSWDVLDIVTLANCVLDQNCGEGMLYWEGSDCGVGIDCYGCAGDMNGDGYWNALDLVALGNCILANTCGRGRQP